MNVRSIWTVAALCAALAVLWLALRTPPPVPKGEPRPSAQVVLPPLASVASDSAPALAELAKSTMWGPRATRTDSAASAPGDAPDPAWFISGVYGQAGQRVLVVRYEAQVRPAQQLRVGQRLPDGARIEAIEIDRVQSRPASAPGQRRPPQRWQPGNRALPVPDN